MTLKKIPPAQEEMRYFIDALRGALGLQPLYTQLPQKPYFTEAELPYVEPSQQWFQPVAGVPEQISEKRDRSIEFAVRKLTQAAPVERPGNHTSRAWNPKTAHDTELHRHRVLRDKNKVNHYPRRSRGQEKA